MAAFLVTPGSLRTYLSSERMACIVVTTLVLLPVSVWADGSILTNRMSHRRMNPEDCQNLPEYVAAICHELVEERLLPVRQLKVVEDANAKHGNGSVNPDQLTESSGGNGQDFNPLSTLPGAGDGATIGNGSSAINSDSQGHGYAWNQRGNTPHAVASRGDGANETTSQDNVPLVSQPGNNTNGGNGTGSGGNESNGHGNGNGNGKSNGNAGLGPLSQQPGNAQLPSANKYGNPTAVVGSSSAGNGGNNTVIAVGRSGQSNDDSGLNSGPKSTFALRLAGYGSYSESGSGSGSLQSGWLQVSEDNGTTWGSVCFQRFGVAEATVACRQMARGTLGLPRGASSPGFAASVPAPEGSALSTLLNVQHCAGNEASLADCPRRPWATGECISEDGPAGVACIDLPEAGGDPTSNRSSNSSSVVLPVRLVNGSELDSGVVEVSLGHGLWGTVCGSGTATAAVADVVCRQLSYAGGGDPLRGTYTSASAAPAPVVLSQVRCRGDEAALTACPRSAWGDAGACATGVGSPLLAVICYRGPLPSPCSKDHPPHKGSKPPPVYPPGHHHQYSPHPPPTYQWSPLPTYPPPLHSSSPLPTPLPWPPLPSATMPLPPPPEPPSSVAPSDPSAGGVRPSPSTPASEPQPSVVQSSPSVVQPSPSVPLPQAPSPLPPTYPLQPASQEPLPSSPSSPSPPPTIPLPPSPTLSLETPPPPPPPSTNPEVSPEPPEPSTQPAETPQSSPPPPLLTSPTAPGIESASPPPEIPLPPSNSPPPAAPPSEDPPSTPPPPSEEPQSTPPPPSETPSPPPSTAPPSTRLPPLATVLLSLSEDAVETPSLAVGGVGFVTVLSNGGSGLLGKWSFLCGDLGTGWNADAANVACRQAGYSAGGEPLRIWRGGALPQLLPVTLLCSGAENTLSECDATAPPGAIDAWQYGSSDSGGGAAGGLTTCQALAGVRCRGDPTVATTVALRAAAAPPPSGTTLDATAAAAAAAGITAVISGAVFVARLEASVNNGPYGAVCLDDGFDAAAAAVACRSLGFSAVGAAVYGSGAAAGTANADATVLYPSVDSQGSYLGVLSSVRCSGREESFGDCAAWRADLPVHMVPCQAAAWVVCQR